MKPRVSISDEALSHMGSALEEAAFERMIGEVVRKPWVCLYLEQTAKDSRSDRFPVVCRDGMAPVVVACIRAAARACDDTSEKRELQRAAKAVKDAYGVDAVPTIGQAMKVLAERGMIAPSQHHTDAISALQEGIALAHDPFARPPFTGFPRWVVVLAAGVGGSVLIVVLIAVLLAMAD